MDLDRISYVLERHRGRPGAPKWYYAILTAEEMSTLRRAVPLTPPADDAAKGEWIDTLSRTAVAIGLREVRGLRRGGQELVFPVQEDLEARIAWIKANLPYVWVHELSRAIQDEAEFDQEEERAGSN